MKGKLQLLSIAIVAYNLGCILRHKKCQSEWRDRHPYSYTGKESTAGPVAIYIMQPRGPDIDDVKTTPVFQELTQAVEREGASTSTEKVSIARWYPGGDVENKPPVHKKSDPAHRKNIDNKSANLEDPKHGLPKKTTSTLAPGASKTDLKNKHLTTPFPDDPPAGFNSFGFEWRRDEGPGKLFADLTNHFKIDSKTTDTESPTSISTSVSEPEASSEVIRSPDFWYRLFGSSKKAQPTQYLNSVSAFTTKSMEPKEIFQSASSFLKQKTAEFNNTSSSEPGADRSSGGFFGGIIDWVTGTAYPTHESEEANRHGRRIPKKFGFGTLAETSTASSMTESEDQVEATTSQNGYSSFQRAGDIEHTTKSSTVAHHDQTETSTKKSIAHENPGSHSKPSADRKPVAESSLSNNNQQATESVLTAESQPTKERAPFAEPEPEPEPNLKHESKQGPNEDGEENISKEGATKSTSRPKWGWALGWRTGTIYMPHPTFVFLDPGNPLVLDQE